MSDDAVRFAVLGPVEVTGGDGSVVAINGVKQRALLASLLLHRGTPRTVGDLVSELWGDGPPASAEVTVRSHVSHLRRRLAPYAGLVSTPAGYVLDVAPGQLDTARFEELVGLGQEALGLGDPRGAAALLREGLALWRGHPWVELEDVDGAMADSARLEELRLVALEVLGSAELDAGRHREVVGELEALVAQHPFRERLTALLVVALYRSGRQADALAAYHRTRERLADELGLDPGPELQELAQSVLRQEPALLGGEPGRSAPPGAPGHREALREPEDALLAAARRAPLVGREAELAHLRSVWGSIRSGGTGVVLVSGEAGSGKTRLVAEVFATPAADEATVLVGRCVGPASAYAPVIDAFSRSVLVSHVVEDLPESVSHELQPFLDGRGVASGDVSQRAGGRHSLYGAVRRLLAELAAVRPLVLVVEDAESIDHASVRLLAHLVRSLPAGTGVVVCYRDPPGGRHPPLLELVGDPTLVSLVDHLSLGPITEAETAELVARVAPDPAGELAARIWHHTGGNPYFTSEMARQIQRTGTLQLPGTVRDVLRQRLTTLSDQAQQVLPIAAVVGPDVDFELLVHLVDTDEDALVGALEEAVAAGFLVESGEGWTSRYAFPHELVREATGHAVPAPKARRLHLETAHWLQSRVGPNRPRVGTVARHLREAGDAADPAETAEWSLRASREAAAVFAWEEAFEHADAAGTAFRHADDRAGAASAAIDGATLRLRSGRGFDRAVTLLQEALALSVGHVDDDRVGRLHSRLGAALSYHHSAMDIPRALDHFDAAARLLDRPGDAYYLHIGRAQAAFYGVRTGVLDEASRQAERIAAAATHRDGPVIAGWGRAWAAFNAGHLAEAEEIAEQVWGRAHERADPYLVWIGAQAPALRASAYLLDPGAARGWCRRALGQPRFATHEHSQDTMVDQLVLALILQGDLAGATSAAVALPTSSVSGRLMLMAQGRWEEAADAWAASIVSDEAAGDRQDSALHRRWLAWSLRLLGRPEEAVGALLPAVEVGETGPQVPTELAARPELVRLTAHDDPPQAARHLQRCEEILDSGEDWRGLRGAVELARASTAYADGAAERGDAHLTTAVGIFEGLGLPWHVADAWQHGALLAERRGDREKADRRRAAALRVYTSLSADRRWHGH